MFDDVILWGTELSPYQLKLSKMLDVAQIRYRELPIGAGRWENVRVWLRLRKARRRRAIGRWPAMTELDEYPSVPFLLEAPDAANRETPSVWYDSTGIGLRIDALADPPCGPLVPEDPALGFVVRFVEEAFDEFGLYMVHHHRWVVSAMTNNAASRLARDFAKLLPPKMGTGTILLKEWCLSPISPISKLEKSFPGRQVGRLPYLFSVAPADFDRPAPVGLEAPAPEGFPATHELLEWAWDEITRAVDELLEKRAFLFGERFTLADAAIYGQLAMNLTDGETARLLARRTPGLYAWLRGIEGRGHVGRRGELALGPELKPLLSLLFDIFAPLMRANEEAYDHFVAEGETLFNEKAFDEGRSLYEGTICGVDFRSVVKTFQVQSWRELRTLWEALDDEARAQVTDLMGGDPFVGVPPET
jgi:glutathione S-transferase